MLAAEGKVGDGVLPTLVGFDPISNRRVPGDVDEIVTFGVVDFPGDFHGDHAECGILGGDLGF